MSLGRRNALAGAGLLIVGLAIVLVALHHSARRSVPGSPGGGAASMTTTATATTARTTTAPLPRPGLPAPVGPEQFGASVNRLFNDFAYTPAEIDRQLTGLQATGVTVARSDALWQAAEPTPPHDGVHQYAWEFTDQIAAALAAHDLTWLPILDYSPPWAQSVAGEPHSPPRDDADFAAYAGAFAARYSTGGTFWSDHPGLPALPVTTIEIWNEPDNGEFWKPAPSPVGYAELYLSARVAIDAVDPSVRVIVGGLTAPATFLPAMRAGDPAIQGHLDGVAIHPYGPPGVVVAKIRAARATLTALGMATVPLYVTEFGWTTSPPGALDYAADAVRPAWIRQTLATLGHLDCGLALSVLYTWFTPASDPDNSQNWYGISGTPSGAAFATGLRAATAPGGTPIACG